MVIRAQQAVLIALIALGGAALAPAGAQAGAGASAAPTLEPQTITVGDSGTGSITLSNANTGTETSNQNRVCNLNDLCPSSPDTKGISLVPSCADVLPGTVCSNPVPDVFSLSAQGTGRAGTACAGFTFDIVRVTTDAPDIGRFRFTPQGNSNVVLAGPNPSDSDTCVIDFTFRVLKAPQGPTTRAITFHNQQILAKPTLVATGLGSAPEVRINKARPTIETLASPNVVLGGQLTDQATVSGLVSPIAGSTVTFRLFPPSAGATCTGAPVFVDTKPVTLTGSVGRATTGAFTPTETGTYRWVATFDGDANNATVTGNCNEATETRDVTAVPPNPPPPGTPPPGPPPPSTPPPGPPAPGTPPASNVAQVAPSIVCVPPASTPAPGAPGAAPGSGKICAPGTASIRGATGCVGTPFKVVVRGSQIARVVYTLDGKVIRTLTKANSGSSFVLPVNPRTMRVGIHRILARTTFRNKSTRARTLRVTFSRCSRRARAPRPAFTG